MWWWIAGGLAALVATPMVVGWLLPKRYRNGVVRELPAPPEEVFRALLDFDRHPMTGSMRRRTETIAAEGTRQSWREDMGNSVVTVRTVDAEPPRRLVRELEDSVVPMRSRWQYLLEPTPSGTRVTVVEEGTIEAGTWHVPLFRIMVRVMKGRGIQAHLDAVAQSLASSR
jgi:uncharacterized protein YndB with AHSA1/START domain